MIDKILLYYVYIATGIAAIIDYKTRTIPLFLFPSTAVIYTLTKYITYSSYHWFESMLAVIIMALVFGILAKYFKGGGGDITMMCCLGWCLGLKDILFVSLLSSIEAFLILFVYKIQGKLHKNTVAYAPCVFVGYSLYLFILLTTTV